jgi:hypothetical protein
VAGLPAECQPNTVYSWDSTPKLDMMNGEAGQTTPWAQQLSREIFARINPVATFEYAPIPIRFKLKKGVKFFLYTADALPSDGNAYCTQSGIDPSNTIFVRNNWIPDNHDRTEQSLQGARDSRRRDDYLRAFGRKRPDRPLQHVAPRLLGTLASKSDGRIT